MGSKNEYRRALRETPNWDVYLSLHSGLPGPRGNLELAYAVADEGDEQIFTRLLAHDSPEVHENTAEVFLVFCGIVGLGKLLIQGQGRWLGQLRIYANDPRWRIREAVAIALQIYASTNPPQLLDWMRAWMQDSLLELRAVVAALCEPSFLVDPDVSRQVLEILDEIMLKTTEVIDRKSESFRILRQTLGYGWSVAVAALPVPGKGMMERWCGSNDPDILWIMRENLSKNRLQRLDPQWCADWLSR